MTSRRSRSIRCSSSERKIQTRALHGGGVEEPQSKIRVRLDARRRPRLEGVLVLHGHERLFSETGGVVDERRAPLAASEARAPVAFALVRPTLGPVPAEEKVSAVSVAVVQEHVQHARIREHRARVHASSPAPRLHRGSIVARLLQFVRVVHPVHERARVERLVVKLDAAGAIRRRRDQIHPEHTGQLVRDVLHGRAVPPVAVALDGGLEHRVHLGARAVRALHAHAIARMPVLSLHLAHRLHPRDPPALQQLRDARACASS